jgi:hypothetical protein
MSGAAAFLEMRNVSFELRNVSFKRGLGFFRTSERYMAGLMDSFADYGTEPGGRIGACMTWRRPHHSSTASFADETSSMHNSDRRMSCIARFIQF